MGRPSEHRALGPQGTQPRQVGPPGDFAAKRDAAVAALRNERNVPPPNEPESAPAPEKKADAPPHEAPSSNDRLAAEFAYKQGELAKAEAKVSEARTAAEKRAAEADAKLKRLELATANPLEFLSEVGLTEAEWKDFLANGGRLSPEAKRTRELEKQTQALQAKLDEISAQQAKSQADILARIEQQQFEAQLDDFPLLPHFGGPQVVRQQVEAMRAQGKHVSYAEAAKHLSTQWQSGLDKLLQDPKARSMLGLDKASGSSPQTKPAASPSTLSSQVTSHTGVSHERPAPLDFAAKRQLLLARLKAQSRG